MMRETERERLFPLLVNGQGIITNSTIAVSNPADGSLVGKCALATVANVDDAVSAAVIAQKAWAALPDRRRAEDLHAISAIIEANTTELAELVTLEQGKPLAGLGSEFEVQCCVEWTQAASKLSLRDEFIQTGLGRDVIARRIPVGVVGSITPWNWPLLIAAWHMMPAIRAGCAVIIKPSPVTPLSTLRLVEIMNEVLPPGVINSVSGGAEIAEHMVDHPGISKIIFTGSTQVGKSLLARSANTLKRMTLELSGNDPGIILPGTNTAAILDQLVWSCLINSGQTCNALKRLYVHESQYEDTVETLADHARGLRVGDGRDRNCMIGPLTTRAQVEHVDALVQDARNRGARIVCGGERPKGPGCFYPVTVVADATDDMRVVREEQFGPVIPMIRYASIEEAVRRANSLDFGLGGSVWGEDPAMATHVANRLECGTVWVNDHGTVHPTVPFAGLKSSGLGVQFGIDGLKEFTSISVLNALTAT